MDVMTDAATLQARLAEAEARLASALISLQHGDTRRQNASLTEQMKMIEYLKGQLAAASGTHRVRYAYQSGKGL
jgi:hypothetical protein